MMNGNPMKFSGKGLGTLFILWLLGSGIPSAIAGNRVMIEEQVQELSDLNQKLLSQEPELPKDGHLELKAQAKYGKDGAVDLRVYSRKFSTIDEKPINFEGKQTQVPSK